MKVLGAFNEFLKHDSWSSLNWFDMERFYKALNVVALNNGFTAEALGDFLNDRDAPVRCKMKPNK